MSRVVRAFNLNGARVTGIVMPDGSESQVQTVVFHGVNILSFLEADPDLNAPLLEKLDQLLQEEVK